MANNIPRLTDVKKIYRSLARNETGISANFLQMIFPWNASFIHSPHWSLHIFPCFEDRVSMICFQKSFWMGTRSHGLRKKCLSWTFFNSGNNIAVTFFGWSTGEHRLCFVSTHSKILRFLRSMQFTSFFLHSAIVTWGCVAPAWTRSTEV